MLVSWGGLDTSSVPSLTRGREVARLEVTFLIEERNEEGETEQQAKRKVSVHELSVSIGFFCVPKPLIAIAVACLPAALPSRRLQCPILLDSAEALEQIKQRAAYRFPSYPSTLANISLSTSTML